MGPSYFIIGIPILVKPYFNIETGQRLHQIADAMALPLVSLLLVGSASTAMVFYADMNSNLLQPVLCLVVLLAICVAKLSIWWLLHGEDS